MRDEFCPRPEYPRPQFVRRQWRNLNGEWEFLFDDANVGLLEHWWEDSQFEQRILVPFPYQAKLSGIGDPSIHEVVWYARNFEVPEEWLRHDLLLHFGAVDYSTTVWANGREVGHNRGGHVPFSFNVTPYLHPGENRLVLRVEDRQDPHQPRGKQSSTGLPHGIDYYCTTGIWQTVWLEPAPSVRIEELRIRSNAELTGLDITVFLHAPSIGWRLEIDVYEEGRLAAQAVADTAGAVAQLFLELPNPRRWSPDDPHLYDLAVRLIRDGSLVDEARSYAGLRTIASHGGRLFLNDEPLYLRMVLDQGYWPEGLLAAPSDAALQADVEWVKRLGFNGVRKHQKIEDPRWLYWCDQLGLLVWEEMPNARAWSSEAEELLLAEWQRAVARDYNHPCIIAWVPVNESMGFPGLREQHPGQIAFIERTVGVTRRLDPERLVIDNDGWEHTDVADILAIHDYTHSGTELRERYEETLRGGKLPACIWTGRREVLAAGSLYYGQPVMLTEVGGYLYRPDIPPGQLDRLYQIYGSFTRVDKLLHKYRELMEALAELPFLSGFCYTQLTDIEQELNGLLTYDRRPKIDPEKIAELHQRLFTDQAKAVQPLSPGALPVTRT